MLSVELSARLDSLWPTTLRSDAHADRRGWIAKNMVDNQPVPDEQHDQRTYGRTDKSGALIEFVPADGLANKCANKCAANSEHSRQNESGRLIRSRRHKARNSAGDESNHNDPDDIRHDGHSTVERHTFANVTHFREELEVYVLLSNQVRNHFWSLFGSTDGIRRDGP